MCSDPVYSFCDTQGTLGGEINECIAVECTPNAFAECRGDVAVLCNDTGDNYLLDECAGGCAAEYDGCMVEPSNGLGAYLDMVETPEDLTLLDARIDTYTGAIDGSSDIPSFLVPAPEGGASIRVFVARRVRLGDLTVMGSGVGVQPALAIIALADITVEGNVTLAFSAPDDASTFAGAPGGVEIEPCAGGVPQMTVMNGSYYVSAGIGGGAHATAGGTGGEVTGLGVAHLGGRGGMLHGTADLVPLRGGCSSGYQRSHRSGRGGGAIQLTSFIAIRIAGIIDARGEPGRHSNGGPHIEGGDAGGGILLEAPVVELGSSAQLIAGGGGGASRQVDGSSSNGFAAPGGSCTLPACGAGGDAASAGSDGRPGDSVAFVTGNHDVSAGGGGGGLGRIRINTADATYVKASGTREVGVVSADRLTR